MKKKIKHLQNSLEFYWFKKKAKLFIYLFKFFKK